MVVCLFVGYIRKTFLLFNFIICQNYRLYVYVFVIYLMTLSVVKTVYCCIIGWLISWLTICHFHQRIVFVEEYNIICSDSHYGVGNLDSSNYIYCLFRLLQGAQSWYPFCLYCRLCFSLLSSVILCQQFFQSCVCCIILHMRNLRRGAHISRARSSGW